MALAPFMLEHEEQLWTARIHKPCGLAERFCARRFSDRWPGDEGLHSRIALPLTTLTDCAAARAAVLVGIARAEWD